MKLSEIVNILEATVLVGNDQLDKEVTKAGASDLMSDILAGLSDECILLTGLITIQAIRTALVANVSAVVFVRSKNPPPEVIELAKELNVPILRSPYSMFVSCGKLHRSGITGLDGKT